MIEKEFFSIKEVADMLELKPYILRYWEKEFAVLKPRRNRVGRRYYSKKDIDTIRLIKNILYNQGYTIAGAKKKLVTLSEEPEQLSLPLRNTTKILREIREELKSISEKLKE
ncbi:MAG TPA: MerR family transcriptional regulator [candidate division WOR-3 bacterium]|uniref:MerR family transcriptional regulator n=1 Tax=candidate division WOR-3 bacterium TaxID=2052148 RepID=A0A9C9K0N3_UNCW3|nr:MerR family transcriptional regulator [candidate division WOR-3 bacterium]